MDFSISVGETRTIDSPSGLAQAISECVTPTSGKMPPLRYGEFSKLVESGSLTKTPNLADPFLYVGDAELGRSDAELRLSYPEISPEHVRSLRKAFIYKKARDAALKRIAYEKEVLSQFAATEGKSGKATYSRFVEYLEAFHAEDMADFFRPWALPISGRDLKAHSYIAARSGHGKSELIKIMLYGLFQANQGAILFDPHGDIAEEVVRWREFADDPSRLVYFSPHLGGTRMERVPVINPLAPLHCADNLDSAVENFVGVISAVVGGDFDMSVRMKMLLRPCLYTLAEHPETTLYDLIDFLAEDPKRDKAGNQTAPTPWTDKARKLLENRALLDILSTFFDKSYDTTKAAIRDRLRTFLASNGLDRCLAGASTIDLAEAMDAGKFIVFNLSCGSLGEETSATFGRFLLAAIQNTAMQRQSRHASERRPVFTFIDEADRLLSESVAAIYKETRKYGLHLAIAQQITGYRMSRDVRRAVFGNSNVRIAGGGGGDADTTDDLARLTGIDRREIEALPPRVFYVKCGDREAVRFTVPSTLAGRKNAMSGEDWERVKGYQLAHYYRSTKPHGSPPSAHYAQAAAVEAAEPIRFI